MTERRTTTATWRDGNIDKEPTVVEIDVDFFADEYGTTPERLRSLSNEQLLLLDELQERKEWLAKRDWSNAEELCEHRIREIIHPSFTSDRVTERIESLRDRIETKEEYQRPTERTEETLREYHLGRQTTKEIDAKPRRPNARREDI